MGLMKLKRKKINILIATLLILTCICGCSSSILGGTTDGATQGVKAELDKQIGAFEVTAALREAAKTNTKGYDVLDAGRGNPNWINTQARYAFTRLMEFALSESERTMHNGNMAGQAQKEGIGDRFDAAMNIQDETDAFLISSVRYCVDELCLDKDTVLKEWCDGIIGDYYPFPSRCLGSVEKILNAYLESTLYNGKKHAEHTKIFPTEGGTAAIVYIFNSLNHNRLLKQGDTIAIATPIFTPYLQIPDVDQYSLISVDITTSAEDNWDISDEEIEKLADPNVKALFLVNPSNPSSHALSETTLDKIEKVVEKNPNLIIITDDVYGTFANDFETVYSRVPENTILVYSFSKLYGVTGWRIGLIAMQDENVMDRLLTKLEKEDTEAISKDYSFVSTEPYHLPFVERIVADSRSIGLYHTGGLSTPQQIFMSLLSLTHLTTEEDTYINLANNTVRTRYETLMRELGLPADETDENAMYYTLVDIHSLARNAYGNGFADWLAGNVSDLDFLRALAVEEGVVLMHGPGFDASSGTVRISIANLNESDYVEIARRIYELLGEYQGKYRSSMI